MKLIARKKMTGPPPPNQGKESKKPLLFKGYAKTVQMKKKFLEAFPKYHHRMKRTAYELKLTPGTVTSWCLTDPAFKEAYTRLKQERPRSLKKPQPTESGPRQYTLKTPPTSEETIQAKDAFLSLYEKKALPPGECCKKINASPGLMRVWLATDPAFRAAYQHIAAQKRGLLDEDSHANRDVIEKAHQGIDKARIKRQNQFLKVYVDTTFNITEACKAAGIARQTFKHWLKRYPEFKERFADAFETKKDFIEGKLLENIKANDSACIIHASKTLLKDRGYGEKQEIEVYGKFGVMVVPGTMEDAAAWSARAVTQQQNLKKLIPENGHQRQQQST